MKIYLDGKFCSERDAKVSVFDHGLLYGDGIFEGIRIYNGRVFKLKEHIDRLFYSAKAILLEIPMSHAARHDEADVAVAQFVRADGFDRSLHHLGVRQRNLQQDRLGRGKQPVNVLLQF